MLRIIESWQPNPAHIMDRHWNIKAMNTSAHLVFGFHTIGVNCLTTFFDDDRNRAAYPDEAQVARRVVAQFRGEMTDHPGDPGFSEIVDSPRARNPRFAELRDRHEVQAPGTSLKVYLHPDVGESHFESTQLRAPEWPDLRLIPHTPLVETDTKLRLELLMSVHEHQHFHEGECNLVA